MNDFAAYILNSLIWTVVGLLIGLQLGWTIARDQRISETKAQHRWNAVVGVVLLMMGIGMVIQGQIVHSEQRKIQACLIDHSEDQLQRNLEESKAMEELLGELQASGDPVGTPEARPYVAKYQAAVEAINVRRRDERTCG